MLWYARGISIAAPSRHAGVGCVMSIANAVGAAAPLAPLSAAVPVFRTLPGRYIAALCPSRTTGSTVDHLPVVRSSLLVATTSSFAPAPSTDPSGSTNMNGQRGPASRADVTVLKRPVAGSKISGRSARHVRHVWPPDVTSMRPSGSPVAVGYQRRYDMFGSADHDCVFGSKMFALAAPSDGGS